MSRLSTKNPRLQQPSLQLFFLCPFFYPYISFLFPLFIPFFSLHCLSQTTRTRTMATLENASPYPSSSIEVELIASDSSDFESLVHLFSLKKFPCSSKKKGAKKSRIHFPHSFIDDDSLLLWGIEHKMRLTSFSKRTIVPWRIINLEHLEASHCSVSAHFRAQKLSLLLHLYRNEFFEERVHLFNVNL